MNEKATRSERIQSLEKDDERRITIYCILFFTPVHCWCHFLIWDSEGKLEIILLKWRQSRAVFLNLFLK